LGPPVFAAAIRLAALSRLPESPTRWIFAMLRDRPSPGGKRAK